MQTHTHTHTTCTLAHAWNERYHWAVHCIRCMLKILTKRNKSSFLLNSASVGRCARASSCYESWQLWYGRSLDVFERLMLNWLCTNFIGKYCSVNKYLQRLSVGRLRLMLLPSIRWYISCFVACAYVATEHHAPCLHSLYSSLSVLSSF